MVSYRVALAPAAEEEVLGLPASVQRRVIRWLDLLAEDPRRCGTQKLKGRDDLYRAHAGKDCVIVCCVKDRDMVVLVVRVAHRSEVYRRLPDA